MTGKTGWTRRLWAALWAPLLLAFGARAGEFRASVPGVPSLELPVRAAAAIPAVGPDASATLPQPAPALPLAPAPAAAPAQPQATAAYGPASAGSDSSAPESARVSLDGFFDGTGAAGSAPPASPAPAPEGPRLPSGFVRVVASSVRTEDDVRALIPLTYSPNSETLTRKLIRNVAKMQPYEVYTYFDRRGGKVIGIDLSRKPALIDVLPEQQSHEVRLIKKIQAWNLDLQVVVREKGATPDLIVGGIFTELKSRMGAGKSLAQLLDKANGQVASHALRHGSGPGAVAIDLVGRQEDVPLAEVAQEIDFWRMTMAAAGDPVALRKIYVFSGSELAEFDRQGDGSYVMADRAAMPFAPVRRSSRSRTEPPPRTTLADAFARDRVEKTVRHLMKKGRYRSALRVWEDYSLSSAPEDTERMRRRLGSLLETAKAKAENPKPRTIRRAR